MSNAFIKENMPEIQRKMHKAINEMAVWHRIQPQNVIRLEVDRYYNGKFRSRNVSYMTPEQMVAQLGRVMQKSDSTISEEKGCLFQVVREEAGAPLRIIARYYDDTESAAEAVDLVDRISGRKKGNV